MINMNSKKTEKVIACSVFLLAIFLITFHFTDTPKVWVDEGVFTETAKNLARNGVIGLQTAPGEFFSMRNFLLSTSYPVIFPVAASLKLLGNGIWQARFPMILYMFGLTLVFYFFAKKRYGFYPGILSVLLLLSFSPFYGNGRPVQGEVPGLFFLCLGAYFLLLWEEGRFQKRKWALLSGLAFGLSASTKPIFLLGVCLSLVIALLLRRKDIKNKMMIAWGIVGFATPLLLWTLVHFPTWKSVLNFIPSYLYFAGVQGSETSVLVTITRNLLKFFTESTPLLFALLMTFVILSFLSRYKKEGKEAKMSEYLILAFIILNWIGFLFGTGWYRYFFPAHLLLYLLFPGAIFYLIMHFKTKSITWTLITFSLALLIFQSYHLIFLSDTSFTVKRTRNAELENALARVDPSQTILFYNSIEAAIFLKSTNYYQYLSMGDFLKAGDENALKDPPHDFIFTNKLSENDSLNSCYSMTEVSQYFLLKRQSVCK